jgi:SAM-dependent methyltransferase
MQEMNQDKNSSKETSQEVFKTIYRGRQTWLHHAAYMRMAKVLLALRILRQIGQASPRRVFDYGFGAGTFFRYCSEASELFGVEMDPINVQEVTTMLKARGRKQVDLQHIEIETWKSHPLLQCQYDLFLCSHVLEHLDDPVDFLQTIRPSLGTGGIFLGLVPINELEDNPHHVQKVDRALVQRWADAAGLSLVFYTEADLLPYWLQPLYTADSGSRHKLAQICSLVLGLPATLLGPNLWWKLAEPLGKMLAGKPTQAAFILQQV